MKGSPYVRCRSTLLSRECDATTLHGNAGNHDHGEPWGPQTPLGALSDPVTLLNPQYYHIALCSGSCRTSAHKHQGITATGSIAAGTTQYGKQMVQLFLTNDHWMFQQHRKYFVLPARASGCCIPPDTPPTVCNNCAATTAGMVQPIPPAGAPVCAPIQLPLSHITPTDK
jgi:hypothetical protein